MPDVEQDNDTAYISLIPLDQQNITSEDGIKKFNIEYFKSYFEKAGSTVEDHKASKKCILNSQTLLTVMLVSWNGSGKLLISKCDSVQISQCSVSRQNCAGISVKMVVSVIKEPVSAKKGILEITANNAHVIQYFKF